MEVQNFELPGLKAIKLKLFNDDRGFFVERFNRERFREVGLPYEFVQDNHSRSKPRVLRGLHYQYAPAQGKLVSCVRGRIWDVVVDMR
jgi:dTDP-4-dehydrorhamnose 3,5-epimerase